MKFSRTRLLALLLVAVFSFAAVGATTIASATDASTSAKKKKKCKKGYKKVGKKCKKKKKAAAATNVSSVSLRITQSSIYFYAFAGEVVVKTPVTSIPVKVTATKGSFDVGTDVTATGDGTSTTLTFSGKVKNPITYPGLSRPDSKKPTVLQAVADGISSSKVSP